MEDKKEIIMIEGIPIKELGYIFSGYYLSNVEQATKIINLFRKQGKEQENQKHEEFVKKETEFLKGLISELEPYRDIHAQEVREIIDARIELLMINKEVMG